MSLYYVQKLIYTLNRDPNVVAQFQTDMDGVLKEYTLTDEEKHAIRKPDIGLCLLYTSPSPRDATLSRMPSSA